MKRIIKITGKIILILLAALLIFTVVTYIVHRVKNKECTCKMKVDTHKSVGVYFFRSIMNLERM